MRNGFSVSAERENRFWRDESGAVMVEVTVTILTFLLVLFGIVEFSLLFYQWNAATKATQFGARLAAVSNPLVDNFAVITDDVVGKVPGDPLAAGDYDIVCDGASASCTCSGALCPNSVSYNIDSMRTLVFGRCGDLGETCSAEGTRLACKPDSSFNNLGMCNVFSRIEPENVIVRYQYTGLGYVGRPGGPVPTVTIAVSGIQFQFIMLGGLVPGLTSVEIPGLETTVTGEDLRASGS